jgi:glycosyltransferase involved in cell wall biosynthesis
MSSAIHQFLAGYTGYDAISNEARILQTFFREWGHRSEIYTDVAHAPRELCHDILPANAAARDLETDDVALLHLSIGSQVNEIFASLSCRKVILYHNVTPSFFFEGLNPDLASALDQGRQQTAQLAGIADVNLADSYFNAGELEEMGYRDVTVLPLIVNLDTASRSVDSEIRLRYEDDAPTVLFVGRCAPNKAIEDAVEAFALYQSAYATDARFVQIGSTAGTETYASLIIAAARELGAENVEILGSRPQPYLNAIYETANLFLSMSEHEGFCVPLLESMHHDIPILAYAAGAVPETLDGSGILVAHKDFAAIAEMMHRLIGDASIREPVLAGQRKRLADYKVRNLGEELREMLASVM